MKLVMTPPTLSICVPVYNDAEHLSPLHAAVARVLDAEQIDGELILVDDGSTDQSWSAIEDLVCRDPRVRGLRFKRNCGQTAASDAALRAARGEFVMTMAADLQDDPQDIPRFLSALAHGYDCVYGRRVAAGGQADGLAPVDAGRIGNWLRSRLSDETIFDAGGAGCAFRRACLSRLKLYRGLHRFLPALLKMEGFSVGEILVSQNSRRRRIKDGIWNRLFTGAQDLLAIYWMKRRLLDYQVVLQLDRTAEVEAMEQARPSSAA